MIGDKKYIYHSALVAATREGPIEITLTSPAPIPSKFKDKPSLIGLKHDGDEQFYTIENHSCGEALSGLKGQTVLISASGRDEDAAITIEDFDGKPAKKKDAAPQGRKSAPTDRNSTREELEEKTFRHMKAYGGRVAVALRASFLHTDLLLREMFPEDYATIPFESVRAIAITHFIETKSMVDIGALPTRWHETHSATKKQEPKPQPPVEEAPPENTVEDDDIPW